MKSSAGLDADVAVIGAGPAGCAAAIEAARHGARVLLLERGAPGKDKACGDALVPDAVAELAALGIDDRALARCGGRQFDGVELWGNMGRFWTERFDGERGWVVPRQFLDQALRDLAAAAARVRYSVAILDVLPMAGSGWVVRIRRDGVVRERRVGAVVTAAGATDVLSRSLRLCGGPRIAASVSAYAAARVPAAVFQFSPEIPQGYGWAFPLPSGRANVGICVLASPAPGLRSTLLRYGQRWSTDALAPRGGTARVWSGSGGPWHDRRGAVCCGDAAGRWIR